MNLKRILKWNVDFCKNSKFVQIFKIGLKNWLNQNIVDFTLDYFYFKGCLGPIRPIKSHILFYISVVSNIEPLDTRSFSLGKLCVHARSRFEKVIFCVLILARNSNACLTFICYLMKLFKNVWKSNVRWSLCSKMLKN